MQNYITYVCYSRRSTILSVLKPICFIKQINNIANNSIKEISSLAETSDSHEDYCLFRNLNVCFLIRYKYLIMFFWWDFTVNYIYTAVQSGIIECNVVRTSEVWNVKGSS